MTTSIRLTDSDASRQFLAEVLGQASIFDGEFGANYVVHHRPQITPFDVGPVIPMGGAEMTVRPIRTAVVWGADEVAGMVVEHAERRTGA